MNKMRIKSDGMPTRTYVLTEDNKNLPCNYILWELDCKKDRDNWGKVKLGIDIVPLDVEIKYEFIEIIINNHDMTVEEYLTKLLQLTPKPIRDKILNNIKESNE